MKMGSLAQRENWSVYLVVGELVPRLFPVGEDLPQNHPQTPHVALCGELSVHDAFRRHPADWQHGVTSDLERQHTRGSLCMRVAPGSKIGQHSLSGKKTIDAPCALLLPLAQTLEQKPVLTSLRDLSTGQVGSLPSHSPLRLPSTLTPTRHQLSARS